MVLLYIEPRYLDRDSRQIWSQGTYHHFGEVSGSTTTSAASRGYLDRNCQRVGVGTSANHPDWRRCL